MPPYARPTSSRSRRSSLLIPLTADALGRRLAVVVLVVVLAGCGTVADPSTAGPGTGSAAASSEEPTPSPSPTPVDVVGQFLDRLAEMTEINAEVSGSMMIGNLAGELVGEFQTQDGATRSLLVITFPGLPAEENERIDVDGAVYTRTKGSDLWMEMTGNRGGDSVNPISSALAEADHLEIVGTEMDAGETLHRLEATTPVELGPESLGLTDPSVTDFAVEVAFLAEDDGTPAGILFAGSWTQGPAEAPTAAELDMRFRFIDASVGAIEAPDDPWTVHESGELGYRMAYPASWDVLHAPASEEYPAADIFIAPLHGEVQVIRFDELGDAPPNVWFQESVRVLTEQYGVEPQFIGDMAHPDGLEVKIFSIHIEEGGHPFHFMQAVIVGGPTAWDVNWYSEPGDEAADAERLTHFITSFAPLQ